MINGNRLQAIGGNGLTIENFLFSARIENNVFNNVSGNGVVMLPGSAVGSISVQTNELTNTANTTVEGGKGFELAAIHLRTGFLAVVAGNTISGVGHEASLATSIAGIRADTCIDLRVSDNTIAAIAPVTEFQNPAAGVLVVSPIGRVDITANQIRRQLSPSEDNSAWQAIRILSLTSEAGGKLQGSSFSNLSTNGQVNALSTFAAAVATPVQVGVLSNSLHGYGRGPLAQVFMTGSCRFSDNQCTCTSEKAESVVQLTASTIIAGDNRVESGRSAHGMDLTTGGKKVATVVGNITSTDIFLDGNAIDPPWKPLNLVVG